MFSTNTNKTILFAIILAIAVGALIYFNPYTNAPSSRAETFRVSSGEHDGPQFVDGTIDPYYRVSSGETERFSIKVSDAVGVEKVEVIIKTDNKKSQPYSLKLNTGTGIGYGYWEGSWKIDDTINSNYVIAVTATNANQKISTVEITLK